MVNFEIGDLIKLKPHVENDSFIGAGFGLISDIMIYPGKTQQSRGSQDIANYFEVQFVSDRCWFEQKDIDLILKIR